MALPEPSSVCEAWPVEWCGDTSSFDEATVTAAHEAASRVLWSLTGRRFGVCTVVQGPPPGQSYCGLPPSRFTRWPDTNPGTALWIDGENASVIDVFIDGVAMDQADWTQAGKWLIRMDGEKWPLNTWTEPQRLFVEMAVGFEPPPIAAQAVGELAWELLKACDGADCALPARVQNLSRQGVSMNLIDSLEFLDSGKTGLPICDQFIYSVNPNKLDQGSRVLSPDRRGWVRP